MNSYSKKLQEPVNLKWASALLALGGYTNTGIMTVQGFILVPLYLRFIGPHLYGLWLSSGGILAMLGVLQFGIGNMLIQRVAHAYGQQDLPKAGAYFLNGMFVYLVITSVFVALGMMLSFCLGMFKVVGGSEKELVRCFQLAVLSAGVGIVNTCLRGFAQALLRPLFTVITLAAFQIVGAAATIFLLYRGAGLISIPVGMLAVEVLAFISGAVQAMRLFRGLCAKVRIDRGIIGEFFRVGGALFFAKLGNVLSRESDPLLITLFCRPEMTTAYMVTRKGVDVFSNILNVLNVSTFCTFSHLVGQGDKAKTREVAGKLLAMIYLLGLVGFVSYVGLNHSFVSLWVGKAFALDQSIMLLIGMAFFAGSLRSIVVQVLNGFGCFNFSSEIVFIEGLGKVLLSALLLYVFGLVGAPMALLATSCMSLIVMGFELRSHISLCITRQNVLMISVIVVALFGLGEAFAFLHEPVEYWWKFAYHAGVLILAVSVLCILLNWVPFQKQIREYQCGR